MTNSAHLPATGQFSHPVWPKVLPGLLLGCALAFSCGGGGGNGGNGPVDIGSVSGVVFAPFTDLSADFRPAVGATVRLSGGDYDSTVAADTLGAFRFDQVPARQMTLAASLGLCLKDTLTSINVIADSTITVELTLEIGAFPAACYTLPDSAATRMKLGPDRRTLVLLYDAIAGGDKPALVLLDLTTGQASKRPLDDLNRVYDLAIVGTGEVVFNFKSANGHGLRFMSVPSLTLRSDVIYDTAQSLEGGRLAVGPHRETVFVTAGRPGFEPVGKVYAISVSQAERVDADNKLANGNFAFDNDLVSGAFGWADGVAFDSAADEILVGNRYLAFGQTPHVTAIKWSMWGTFDRDSNLTLPTPGVRRINMDPGITGFAVVLWDFDGGIGIAAAAQSNGSTYLRYESRDTTYAGTYTELRPSLVNDVGLTIVSERQSWFALFVDASRPEEVKYAVEERSSASLQRVRRFESRLSPPPGIPSAFTVDPVARLLYVAYWTQPIVEAFPLP